MKLNILKFKTDKGIPLIFDNYSGIVIVENKYTEIILRNIEKDKNNIIEEMKLKDEKEIHNFIKEYQYLTSLVNAGYFNYELFKLAQNDNPINIYGGISSHLILITTEECNLRCKYCVYSDFYKDKKTYSSKKMSLDTAIDSVNLLIKYHREKIKRGYEDKVKINFYGGEPLLNYELVYNIVNYINNSELKNVEYLVTTNGTTLNDRIIDFLAKNKFLVAFSLDGDELNHNRNRLTINGDKTHHIVVENIINYYEALKKYNNEDQIINITSCYDDYSDIKIMSEFFEDLREKVPTLNVIYNKVYDVDTDYYDYCDKIYENSKMKKNTNKKSIKELFEKYYENGFNNNMIPNSVKSVFTSYYLLKNRKKGCLNLYQGNSCAIGDKLCVSPEGKIYICEKANQELCIGSVTKGLDFRKIEYIYRKFYEIKNDNCVDCPVSRLCDVCFAHFIKNDTLSFNEDFCTKRKISYIRALKLVYTKMVDNENIFDIG